MGLNPSSPKTPGWKNTIRRSARGMADEQLRSIRRSSCRMAKGSDYLNTANMPVTRGTYDEWARALPRSLRIAFRRMRLGMMPGTKTATVRRQQGWKARWGNSELAFDMNCSCAQDAPETGVHVLAECGCTEYIRSRALAAADEVAIGLEGGQDWISLTNEHKIGMLCSPQQGLWAMSSEDFRSVRVQGTRVWVEGMKAYDRDLATQNAALADEVRRRVRMDAQARRREQRAASAGANGGAEALSPDVRRARQSAGDAVRRLQTARATLAGRFSAQQ
jgi:hypothetical protein